VINVLKMLRTQWAEFDFLIQLQTANTCTIRMFGPGHGIARGRRSCEEEW